MAEGVPYAGTDDGLVRASEDAGATWRQAAPLPGMPERVFMNDLTHCPAGISVQPDV